MYRNGTYNAVCNCHAGVMVAVANTNLIIVPASIFFQLLMLVSPVFLNVVSHLGTGIVPLTDSKSMILLTVFLHKPHRNILAGPKMICLNILCSDSVFSKPKTDVYQMSVDLLVQAMLNA